jgi:hypothetical protein
VRRQFARRPANGAANAPDHEKQDKRAGTIGRESFKKSTRTNGGTNFSACRFLSKGRKFKDRNGTAWQVGPSSRYSRVAAHVSVIPFPIARDHDSNNAVVAIAISSQAD